MNRIFTFILIFSLLFASRAAIDVDRWELFTSGAAKISLRGLRPAKLVSSQDYDLGWRGVYFNLQKQLWISENDRISASQFRSSGPREFHCNRAGLIYSRFVGLPDWSLMDGHFAKEFDVYWNTMWYIDANPLSTKKNVIFLDLGTGKSLNMNFEAEKIAVEFSGSGLKAWAIKANGNIYKFTGTKWQSYPGKAREITVTSNGVPYIVSQEATPEGFAIKKLTSSGTWETIPGIGGVSISLDNKNSLYVVTNENRAYREKGVLSQYCPKCGERDNGVCEGSQCLSCLPQTTLLQSPLRCVSCIANCYTCESTSLTRCKKCNAGYFLAPNEQTCLASCNPPLVSYTEAGVLKCRGPCTQSPNLYYHPKTKTCKDTCRFPLNTPGAMFQSCDSCPDNCAVCSTSTQCSQCTEPFILTEDGQCVPSCDPPSEPYNDAQGKLRCKGPCSDEQTNIYYYPVNDTCQATCDVELQNTGNFYKSCAPCPGGCQTCSSQTTCDQCDSDYFLSLSLNCVSSCDPPAESYYDVEGKLRCKGPCADEVTDIYYYPTSDTCQQTCDLDITLPGSAYQSCDPCSTNCKTCSSTTECLECEANYFVFSTGACIDSCELPLISSDVSGVSHCKGPCEDQAPNNYFYPSDQTCKASCGFSISNPDDLFESCDPCPNNCKTCSNSEVCSECIADHFLFEDGTCMDSCEPPLISFTTETGIQSCKKPCVEGQFYYPSNQTCQASCGVPISNPEDIFESCEACPDDCLLCSNTDTCDECISTSFLSPDRICIPSCEAPRVSFTEDGVTQCKGPCADESQNIFYYPTDGSCHPTCDLPIIDPDDFYESCYFCPNDCLSCSSRTKCSQCDPTYFLSPLGNCLASCKAPLRSFTDENGIVHCTGPCDDGLFYYPAEQTCQPACEVEILSQAPFFKSCKRLELRTIAQSMTQTVYQVLNAFAVGSVRGVSARITSKIFPSLKLLNITYSEELETALYTWKTSSLPYPFNFPIPQEIRDQEEQEQEGRRRLFTDTLEEEATSTSFLLNYWDPLCYLVCIIAAFVASWILAFFTSHCGPRRSFIAQVLTALKVMVQNYLLCYIYMTFGDVVFYSIIEFKRGAVSTALQRIGFFAAVTVLAVMSMNVLIHFWVLQKYHSAKKMNKKTEGKSLNRFLEDYKGFKLYFFEFKDDSISQQFFFFFLVGRDIISSVILLTFVENPFMQVLILLSLNLLMIFYLLWKKPWKGGLGALHQFFNESVFFIVLSSMLILTVFDRENSSAEITRNRIGELIINLNFLFNVVTTCFLAVQILRTLFTDSVFLSSGRKRITMLNPITDETYSTIDKRRRTDGPDTSSSDDDNEEDFKRKSRKSLKPILVIPNKFTLKKSNRHHENLRLAETESFDPINEEIITSPNARRRVQNNSETRILGQIISKLISSKENYHNL